MTHVTSIKSLRRIYADSPSFASGVDAYFDDDPRLLGLYSYRAFFRRIAERHMKEILQGEAAQAVNTLFEILDNTGSTNRFYMCAVIMNKYVRHYGLTRKGMPEHPIAFYQKNEVVYFSSIEDIVLSES